MHASVHMESLAMTVWPFFLFTPPPLFLSSLYLCLSGWVSHQILNCQLTTNFDDYSWLQKICCCTTSMCCSDFSFLQHFSLFHIVNILYVKFCQLFRIVWHCFYLNKILTTENWTSDWFSHISSKILCCGISSILIFIHKTHKSSTMQYYVYGVHKNQ